jgi:sugar phosphate isomerase/epimerase
MSSMTRRDLLKLGAVGTAAGMVGINAFAAKERIPIGVQLYSVRKVKGVESKLEAIGKMGYEGVEFAGYLGKTAAELKKILDDSGLKCCGTHTRWNTIQGDELKKTAEFNLTMGNPYLIVPGGLPTGKTAQGWIDAAKKLAEIAAKAKELGCRVGYHNHSHEFHAIDGKVPWELLYDNAGPDVVMQIDTGNCIHGKGDPVKYIRKYPGQAATVHLKEVGKDNPLVGDGDVPWADVFSACETVGGTEWYIVEQERYPKGMDPMKAIEGCIVNLKKMGK